MRKIDLSEEQIQEIIVLRQRGTSWLGIEKITKVPRRAAQHRYAEWERHRISIDLSAARREFAREEYARHMELLTNLGDTFVAGITLPESPEITSSAEDKLDRILDAEIPRPESVHSTERDEAKRTTNRRRNQRLLDALKEHSANEVPWQRLEEWKTGWDALRSLLPRFGKEIDGALAYLLGEDPEAKEDIDKYAKGGSGVEAITKAVRKCPWRSMMKGDEKWAEAFSIRERVGDKEDLFELRCGDDQVAVFSSKDAAEHALKICRKVMGKAKALRVVKGLSEEVARVQEVVAEFEDKLDPLVLRPVILQTRCRICPA